MAIATTTTHGGYKYNFVDNPPDHCICKICQHPSRDAYMTGECCRGQTICKSCLDHWQITARNRKCPVCRNKEGAFNKNYPIEREIKSLRVYCINKGKGCRWQGKLKNIDKHIYTKGCKFEEVKCSNECGKMIWRKYLTRHVKTECLRREVNCQYCHDTGEYQFIEGQHKEECPKLPLPCPNNCEGGIVPREDMEAHRKECPLEIVPCEYYSVGCKRVKLARKDQENHNKDNMKEHLMSNHELTETKNQLAVELTDTKSQLAKLTDAKAQLAAELKDTKDQLYTVLQLTAGLTAILKNAQLVPNTAASHVNIINSMAEIFKFGNQTCPVTIKMSEYSIKRKDAIEWFSDPFYTHNNGYKMCLRVDAAGHGDGTGTHLSVYMYLMKGPNDDELTWPLREVFEIKLLNQISCSEHHPITVTYDDNTPDVYSSRVTEGQIHGWGKHQYISDENLDKITSRCQFLKTDCLFFLVTKL